MGSSLTLNFKNSVAVLVLRLGDLQLWSFQVANPKSCCIRKGTVQILLHKTVEFYSRAGLNKVETILKCSLNSIPSPSSSEKIQNMGGKVGLRCTLLMFCLLNPQMNACKPNPKTTSSDFNRLKSVTKIFCFHAISTDICLLF